MAAQVVSKNPYDLLGNDDDSDTPKAPVKTVDKVNPRTTKRNTPDETPASKGQPTVGGARRGPGGNEGAFRDRGAGSDRNRGKPTDESSRGGPRGGHNARVRGGRGSRFPRDRDDRHSRSLPGSDKQAAQGWGATEGEAELKDEQAGEDIAQKEQKEQKEAVTEDTAPVEDNEPPVEEDKSISYADYLAQQAEKKLALEAEVNIRKPNEGSKIKKEWAAAKPLAKEDDEDFIAGSSGKAKRERERKTKQLVELDNRFIEQDRPRGGGGGGRGGPRGGGRGEFRGGRGGPRGGSRGDFASRGEFRGGRGGGGARENQPLNPHDEKAFPSLGS